MPKQDPYRQFRFRVDLGGKTQGGFSECTFADTTTDPIEYREGDEPPVFRKLSGLTKYGGITLKWGVTDSLDLFTWRQQVIETGAEGARVNMAIILVDEAGNDKARWDVVRAWPTKYDPADFNAKSNEIAVETLELAHEGFRRVS